jgi:hypothetical protein
LALHVRCVTRSAQATDPGTHTCGWHEPVAASQPVPLGQGSVLVPSPSGAHTARDNGLAQVTVLGVHDQALHSPALQLVLSGQEVGVSLRPSAPHSAAVDASMQRRAPGSQVQSSQRAPAQLCRAAHAVVRHAPPSSSHVRIVARSTHSVASGSQARGTQRPPSTGSLRSHRSFSPRQSAEVLHSTQAPSAVSHTSPRVEHSRLEVHVRGRLAQT